MAEFRILLEGIRASGRHGANPGERDGPQEFVVDLEVTVEVEQDSLEQTADYRELADLARATVENDSFELLETLADAVALAVFDQGSVKTVTATVHKPAAAKSLGVADVSAESVVEG